jgi:O-acetyl-ADP-ribose deacetylase (regulator of RNase III)
MLIYYRTSILESSSQTVVNTVNCVGVMGKGIADAFKQRYPSMFRAYKTICDQRLLTPGKLWLWRGPDQWVLNFPTKDHWRNPSRLEWIEAGLRKFKAEYERHGIVEISFPRLGCGNGGLNWSDVRPLMEAYLSKLPIQVYIHDYEVPLSRPEHAGSEGDGLNTAQLRQSFAEFERLLHAVIDRHGNSFWDAAEKVPFRASIVEEGALSIEAGEDRTVIDVDHLRGLWFSLSRGLLTNEVVRWSAGDQAQRVMSLLSLLPDVRPVQVQRMRAPEPEVALELKRRGPLTPRKANRAEQFLPSWA